MGSFELREHEINSIQIAEIISDHIVINNSEDGLDLLGNTYYQGFNKVIIHEKMITPNFFNLKTGIAGEILQKFSTYRIQLFITGDVSKYASKSLADFIRESNNGNHVNFLDSTAKVLEKLGR